MRSKEISFGYIKSEGIDGACEAEVRRQLEQQDLELIWTKDVFMSYLNLREHQPILFDIRGDLNDIWKIQGAARLIGTTVRTMGVLGIEAIDRLMDVKLSIRDQFALPCEFDRENKRVTLITCMPLTTVSKLSKTLKYSSLKNYQSYSNTTVLID